MKKIYSLLVLVLILNNTFSQKLWQKVDVAKIQSTELIKRNNFPKNAFYYKLDLQQLKNILVNAPERWVSNDNPIIVQFPNSEGKLQNYKVLSSPIMHPDLAEKYPSIKTYVAQGIDDPTAYMRFSVTQFGLHTMCLSGNNSPNYIDPYTKDIKYYIVYNKESLGKDTQAFECTLNDYVPNETTKTNENQYNFAVNDQKFRKYRLALSCNAEYGNIFATNVGTEKADIQAQMTISINRVNTVYEVDLGIQLEFIANNDLLIYFGDVNADPWDWEFNTTTAQTIDNTIGVNNYDIGHNFNTTGGGNAGCLSCVCLSMDQNSTHKGRGETGRTDPTGDPFDIDYVAHEMGHQFGGYHTMNTCSRSGNGQTEVEPASGSSIMGYAGICVTNVQANSDAHFNYVNIRDISANTQAGGNSDCATEISISNQPPTADAGLDYTIPKSTAFVLEGTATDPNGMASLTYNWSQNDPEEAPSGSPQSTWVLGPLYRAIYPTSSPNRYLPKLSDVIAGNLSPTWEMTPSVARTMEFSFIVRDNDIQGGQTADDLMTVTVDGNAGPFTVTSQSTNQNWLTGETKTITWNVAGTNSGAVNSPNVDIFLSLDGGYTYPITLANNTTNDGSASVTIPSNAITNNGKIMVRGANNIFYALNSGNIVIQAGDFTLNFASTTVSTCNYNNVVYNFTYTPQNGFNETVSFSTSNLPTGVTATFSPNNATNTTNGTLTLSGLSASNLGLNNFIVNAISTSANQTINLVLEVATLPSTPNLISPANNSIDIATNTSLNWNSTQGVYNLEISTDPNFATTIETVNNLNTNTYTSTSLQDNTTYYWHVSTTNTCGTSAFSSTYSFTTSACLNIASTDIPVTISASGTPTITSEIVVNTNGIIDDLNVLNIGGLHSWISDLSVSLTSPSGTTVLLWSNICNNNDDFQLNFDDDATNTTINCPPTDNGFYQAQGNLSDFNGESALGTWVLTVNDNANADGGSLESWSLDLCTSPFVCDEPDIPTISATDTDICENELTSLSISSGNLNDATNWVWYKNTCGTGIFVGTGNTINQFPSTTTTYFVRGEGGCVTNSNCANIVINVHENIITTENVQAVDSFEINNAWYYNSQEVINTYSTSFGCDSTVKTYLTITTSSNPDAIVNINGNDIFKLFPNPNNGQFTIDLNEILLDSDNEIIIYDMLGKEIIKRKDLGKTNFINLEKYSKGVYHIYFHNEKYIIQRDIVVF